MPTLAEVLTSPGSEELAVLTEGGLERRVDGVRLLGSIQQLDRAAPDMVVLLTSPAAHELDSYRFDVAIRRASTAGITAIVIPVPEAWEVPATSGALAHRAGISVVAAPDDADLAQLAIAIGHAIAGDMELALAELARALDRMTQNEEALDEVAVVAAVSAVVPSVELRERASPGTGVAIVVDGREEASLAVDPGANGIAQRAALALGAGAIGRIRTTLRRSEEVPIRSVTWLLTELLAADPTRSPALLNRARALGLPVDGAHVVTRLEVSGTDAQDVVFELLETMAQVALTTARGSGGTWHAARSESAILLIRMWDDDPGPSAARRVTGTAKRVVTALLDRFPGQDVRGGVGSVHEGPIGLRASAAEARATIGAARTTGRHESVTSYDLIGLKRMLLEWYASDTARDSVHALLSPLEGLGPRKADTAIRTLQVFLDEQGSTSRTARVLHLHRNAVAYRIGRIAELLDADLQDADQRLALQLACRARLLS